MVQYIDPELLLRMASRQPGVLAPGWYVGSDGKYYRSSQPVNPEAPDAIGNIVASYQRPYDPEPQNFDPNLIRNLVWGEPVVTSLRGQPSVTPITPQQSAGIPIDQPAQQPEFRFDNSTVGRYTPSMFDPEGRHIREALEMTPDTLRTPTVINPNAPKPPDKMEPRPAIPAFTTPYKYEGDYIPTPQAAQPSQAQAGQPQQSGMMSGLENYLQYFQKTLGDAPELDKKKRNQLAAVAAINALGQGLKNVVDYTGRVKNESPINLRQDQLTPALLGQYEKEMQDYLQRKAQYDLKRTMAMQDAFKYAYGDKQAQDDFDREMDKLIFAAGEADKTRRFEADEASKTRGWKSSEEELQRKWGTGEREGAHGDALERMKEQFEYDMALEKERNKGRVGSGSSKLVEEIENGWEVMDNKNGQVAKLPKVMFWDVLTRELKAMNMTPEALMSSDRKPSEGYASKEDEAKAIVTNGWSKYYDPVYENGKQIGWQAKPEAGNMKTIWDFIPMDGAPASAAPQATPGGDETPNIFIPKK